MSNQQYTGDVQDDEHSPGGVELGEIINTVKAALIDAQEQPDMGAKLQSVELTLQTVAKAEGGPQLKFKILVVDVQLGGTIGAENVQTIKLAITPPKSQRTKLDGYSTGDIRGSLVAGIQAIRQGLSIAAMPPTPLVLKNASVELNFTVTRDGKIDIVVFNAEVKSTSVQTIKLTFGPDSVGAQGSGGGGDDYRRQGA
ncbi:MAG: hypothetical protein M3014_05530 [Chloroflexota bacterium]|nr:hypothetical protein [Chloroflexota bacterium]